jgi:hypothetical protein
LIDANGALLREIPELWRQGPVTWWDESGGGRVRSTERTSFGALVLREKSIPVDMSQATLILRQELKRAWPSPYASDDELQQWRNRILTYAASTGEEPIIDLDIDAKGGDFEFLLDVLVDGKVSFAEIGQRSISSGIEELIGYESVVKIQNACPVAIKIQPGGADSLCSWPVAVDRGQDSGVFWLAQPANPCWGEDSTGGSFAGTQPETYPGYS